MGCEGKVRKEGVNEIVRLWAKILRSYDDKSGRAHGDTRDPQHGFIAALCTYLRLIAVTTILLLLHHRFVGGVGGARGEPEERNENGGETQGVLL